MPMRRIAAVFLLGLAVAAGAAAPAAAQDAAPARGILFYSPTCGHCHKVITEDLPVIFADHGGDPDLLWDEADDDPAFLVLTNGTLELLMVNVALEPGALLYTEATMAYRIPDEMSGVPRLVMGREFYVGSGDIPAALPVLIDEAVAAGGFDWPDLPSIGDALAAVPGMAADETTTTTAPATTTTIAAGEETTTSTSSPFPIGETVDGGSVIGEQPGSAWDKFTGDLAGNTLAVIVLAGMLASLVLVVSLVRRGRLRGAPVWLVPVLAVLGVVVAVYLTYVESSGAEAVCGPVGNCNAVQESKFALLFGVIPVGLVGLISYAVVVAAWAAARFTPRPPADWAAVALALGAAGGVAFSIYLTFLEPFVIGATCMWCLSSAVIVTGMWWATAGPAWDAWGRLRASAR